MIEIPKAEKIDREGQGEGEKDMFEYKKINKYIT